jgi:preprotein translocase SecE subunit
VEVERNGKGAREAELAPAEGGGGRRGDRSGALEDAFGEGVPADEAAPARRASQPFRLRAVAFLRASWAELQRVQWPDRPQVTQATAVVLGFLVVAGVYLGVADWAAQEIVNFIL